MAEIKPFRAWRYNPKLQNDMEDLVSPLFDVVSEKQRQSLYENPLSSIHLSVPTGKDPIEEATKTLAHWKNEGIIKQDELPAIYVYYQYFTLPGSEREYCRKGFIANIKVYDWDEGQLLRHENTMPFSVNDRLELLNKTQLNVSPTHGLYTDPEMEIETYLDFAMEHPLYETEDYQGVRETFATIHDLEVIKKIVTLISEKKIILADGHHRYESSLFYKKRREAENPNHTGKEGYNYHMMWFTNTEADDLRILPTHRIVRNLPDFSEKGILKKLEKYFFIKTIDDPTNIHEIILGKKWAFGLLVKDKAYKVRLNPDLIDTISWNFPKAINELDLTVMHYFIFEQCLGIPGSEQRDSRNLSFERDFFKCIQDVNNEDAQCAIITKDISIETVKEVCYSGYTLPQKSTYFYPKVICGFLFGSIKEGEFDSIFDEAFQ